MLILQFTVGIAMSPLPIFLGGMWEAVSPWGGPFIMGVFSEHWRPCGAPSGKKEPVLLGKKRQRERMGPIVTTRGSHGQMGCDF